jgi:hypothetical protein
VGIAIVAPAAYGPDWASRRPITPFSDPLGHSRKVILGFVQTATENRRVCATFLRGLVERGLRFEDGLLVVTDGGKGLHAAVEEVFG